MVVLAGALCFTAGTVATAASLKSTPPPAPASQAATTSSLATSPSYSPPLFSPDATSRASNTGYCWECSANGERSGGWWWGWGDCVCQAGWAGDCCDERDVNIDDRWLEFLESPPDAAVDKAAELTAKAAALAAGVGAAAVDLSDVDVVVSGGGNFDGT